MSSLKYVLIHVFWFCDWRSDNNTRDHKFKLILHYAIPHFKFSLKFAKLLILIYRYDVAVSHCRGMKEIFAANTTSWSLKSFLKENDLDILKMVYFRSWLWIVHYNVLGLTLLSYCSQLFFIGLLVVFIFFFLKLYFHCFIHNTNRM